MISFFLRASLCFEETRLVGSVSQPCCYMARHGTRTSKARIFDMLVHAIRMGLCLRTTGLSLSTGVAQTSKAQMTASARCSWKSCGLLAVKTCCSLFVVRLRYQLVCDPWRIVFSIILCVLSALPHALNPQAAGDKVTRVRLTT